MRSFFSAECTTLCLRYSKGEFIMICKNCGNVIDDGAAFCDNCGQHVVQPAKSASGTKKLSSNQLIIIIASVAAILVAAIIIATVLVIRPKGKNLEKKLEGLTDKQIISFCCDDYNSDGSEEAFAIAGTGSESGFENADIWFVSENAGGKVKENISGRLNGILEENGRKYMCVEVADDGGSHSYIYGVIEPDKVYEPDTSGVFSGVYQDETTIKTVDGQVITIDATVVQGETSVIQQPMTAEVSSTDYRTQKPSTTTERSTTTKRTTTEKSTTKKSVSKEGWREAYKSYLKSFYSQNGSRYSSMMFSLGYVDNDNIPELFVSTGNWHYATVYVVTYHNGKIHDFGEMGRSFGEIEYYRKEGLIIEEGGGSGIITATVSKMNGNSITEVMNVMSGERYDQETDSVVNDYWIDDNPVSEEEYRAEYNRYLSDSKRASAIMTGREGLTLTPSNIEKIDTMNAQ